MKKLVCLFFALSFFVVFLSLENASFSWEEVGPADSNCLACHAAEGGGTSGGNAYPDGYLHQFHSAVDHCGACHCGTLGVTDTYCCSSCHDKCFEVDEHTSNLRDDCASCHSTFDMDADGTDDCLDNCLETPNGPTVGTCVKTDSGVGTGVSCTTSGECEIDEFCDINQEDSNDNGIGDACECYSDFDGDGNVYPSDLSVFLVEYGRTDCLASLPCRADFDGDGNVYPSDLSVFLVEYGKTECPPYERVGVIYVVHGGTDENTTQSLWDAGVQQFSYDPNHPVYKIVIWNPGMWDYVMTVESSIKFQRKYDFEYARIGGTDPFHSLTEAQLVDLEAELDSNFYGVDFEVDWTGWMTAEVEHYPYPRFIYYGPDGPGVGNNCTYCGEDEPGGVWPDCDNDRYNVDGPVERLLKKGVSRIIMVDLTVGGPRFSKTYDAVKMSQRVLDEWNTTYGTSIPLTWINDYSNLMERSFPIEPAGWTRTLGLPTLDSQVLKNGSPNPVSSDPDLATLLKEGIEAGMSGSVTDANTGVLILNHAIWNDNEVFDIKMDDTIVLNENVKAQLIADHPTMDPDNIIGAHMGIKEIYSGNGLEERTREMRGEDLGHQWLYESNKEFPSGGGHPWGYVYWDALEYLKSRGVEHIAVGFTQIITASVLDMVEIPNQVGKEIGIKNWLKWGTGDYTTYPSVGHPFADYWGNWVDTDCSEWDLNYDNGTSGFTGGETLTGQISGATGEIKWFAGDVSAGTLTLKGVSGIFQDDEIITDGGGGSASANGIETMTSKAECCFTMGGCGDPLRPYPPPRQAALNEKRGDMDPSLAYHISEYGHLGYDPGVGAPDPDNPVQEQYTGTWEMYVTPDDDPRVGQLLAKHVLIAAATPMVYLTNGNVESIIEGGSVTFEAQVSGGMPGYTYEWSLKEEADLDWSPVGGDSSSWTWNTGSGDAGTYAIRCTVIDAKMRAGEGIWEDFIVTP